MSDRDHTLDVSTRESQRKFCYGLSSACPVWPEPGRGVLYPAHRTMSMRAPQHSKDPRAGAKTIQRVALLPS